jgi:hypothetical protein
MFYIRTQNHAENIFHLGYTKTNLLMLYKAKVIVCFEICKKIVRSCSILTLIKVSARL